MKLERSRPSGSIVTRPFVSEMKEEGWFRGAVSLLYGAIKKKKGGGKKGKNQILPMRRGGSDAARTCQIFRQRTLATIYDSCYREISAMRGYKYVNELTG